MEGNNYSIKEVFESHLSDMKDGIEKLNVKLENIELTTSEIKIQTTKTNGRVTGLEAWAGEAKKILEKNTSATATLKRDRAIIYSLISAIVVITPFVYSLLQDNLKNQEYAQAKQAVADVLSTYNVNTK